MIDDRRCPRCETLLTTSEKLCPSCLVSLALPDGEDTPEVASPDSEPTKTRRDQPEAALPERIGPYRVLDKLGTGGMGIVYLAEQEHPVRRRVALKLMRPELDLKDVLARFESERQALALMDHPAIAKVFDAGTSEDGRPYFVMERVAGVPITEYCDLRRLGSKKRLELFSEVCGAIQHAHTKGILHRDIKPTNVLVTEADGGPRPKVIDFGIAKALNQKLTEKTLYTALGMLVGTPGYMSPEQASLTPLDVDTRADVYSLGVLLYELLTGSPPFEARRLREAGWAGMLRIIQEEEPPRPSARVTTQSKVGTDVALRRGTEPGRLARELRGDLDWIALKALEKDRTRRYQSAHALAEDLGRHLADEPVTAGPPTFGYRLGKAARRHKAAFMAATAVLAAITAGLVASTILYVRAEVARRETRRQVVGLSVANGMRLADERDPMAALPWLVGALGLEEDEHRREAHRFRIAGTLAQLPTLYRLWGHSGSVQEAVFSRDGKSVATASADKTARVWNVGSSQPISPPLQHEGAVQRLAFDPSGTRVVTASVDGTARIWEVSSGQSALLLKHGAAVNHAEFSPDGTRVLTASDDNTAAVWDAQTGKAIATVRHRGGVLWACFSPDGRAFLTTSPDSTARVWDAATGQPRTAPLQHKAPMSVLMGAFSPDGRRVATASFDWTARVWDASTGAPITPPLTHTFPVGFVAFSPNGRRVVVAAADNAAHVWDVETGTRAYPPLRLTSVPNVARFSPDGLLLLTGDAEGRGQLWESDTGVAVGPPLRHGGGVNAAVFDSESRFVLTAADDGTARVWDLASQEPTHPPLVHTEQVLGGRFVPDGRAVLTSVGRSGFPEGYARVWDADGDPVTPPLRHGGMIFSGLDLSADGRLLATGSFDRTARIWVIAEGEPLGAPLVHPDLVWRTAFSPNARRLVTTSGPWSDVPGAKAEGGKVHVWDVESTKEALPPLSHRNARNRLPVLSPDGRHIVTIGNDGSTRFWDMASGDSMSPALPHDGTVTGMAISPDGARLATVSDYDTLRLWSIPSGSLMARRDRAPVGIALDFSSDGARLVTGGYDGTVQVWDGRTAQRLGPSMMHKGFVYAARFSPDRRWLLTAGNDRTARLWEAETGVPLAPPYRHAQGVWTAEFAPDGQRLLTASLDHTARVWDIGPDTRPIEDLRILAELLAGRRIATASGVVALTTTELSDSWQKLRRQYPEAFEASPRQLQAWHRQKSEHLAAAGRWREAAAHLGQALAVGPKRWALLVARGRAYGELGEWELAAADHAAALAMIPGELEEACDLALAHLLNGQRERLREVRRRLVEQWSTTQNPDRARWAAHATVLEPIEDEQARAQALTWAETALKIEPDRPERMALHGAALFRANRSKEAARELEDAIVKAGGNPPGAAAAFLAMAQHRLGHPNEASRWLARAETLFREGTPPKAKPLTDAVGNRGQTELETWREREELRLLLDEARKVTRTHSTAGGSQP